jgi:ATP-dependent 26S proteasome regulatory subunit
MAISQVTPTNVSNMLLDGMILNQMNSITNSSKGSLNMKNIGGLFLVMSLQEIKKAISDSLEYLKKNYKDLFKQFISLLKSGLDIKYVVQFLTGYWLYKYLVKPKQEQTSKQIKYESEYPLITINTNSTIVKSFVEFVKSNPDKCTYFKDKDFTVNCSDLKTRSVQTTFKNIVVNHDMCSYIFQSELSNTHEIKNSETVVVKLHSIIDMSHSTFSNIRKCCLQSVDPIENNMIIYKKFCPINLHTRYPCFDIKVCNILGQKNYVNYFNYIFSSSFKSQSVLNEFYVYYYYLEYLNDKGDIKFSIKQEFEEILTHFIKTGLFRTPFGITVLFSKSGTTHATVVEYFKPNSLQLVPLDLKHIFNNDTFIESLNKIRNHLSCDVSKNIKMHLVNKSEKSNEECIDCLLDLVSNSSKNETNKVTIHSISIKTEFTVEKKDNPEYEKYKEKKELIAHLKTGEKSLNFDLNNLDIPDKTIEKEISTSTVHVEDINSIEKSLDTLYLRQKDEQLIEGVLKNYSTTEIFDNFGIPKKLGVLLYGEPGTGKSTTIKVIGSYLKKDIYYVNISNVKTNKDMKMIFDHVVKNCSGGGIIVFEDIDAQTNIVKPRQIGINDSINNIMDECDDPLTLSYFLNLLDGTLCAEDTIFIMTTNHKDHLDSALYREGRVDLSIELKLCDHYQINRIFQRIIGHKLDDDILKSIEENKYAPCKIIFHLLKYIYCTGIDDKQIINDLIN